jgi:hypothetical protein
VRANGQCGSGDQFTIRHWISDMSNDKNTTYVPERDTLQKFCLWGLIAAYIVVSLLPLLHSGFYSDDIAKSLIRPHQELKGGSFLDYFFHINSYWVRVNGRLSPVNLFLQGLVYYYANNLLTYKVAILLLVVVNIGLFGYFVNLLTGNKYLSSLLMLVIPSFFQFRLYHDPILSFGGQIQIFFLFQLLSLILLQKYLDGNKYSYLIISVVFYNFCLYSYEVSFVLLPAYLLLIFEAARNGRKSVVTASPFLISILIAGALNALAVFVWKDPSSAGYAGTKMNINISILKTFLIQICAALPLSYYFGNPSNIFDHNILEVLSRVRPLYWLITAFFTIAYLHLSRKFNYSKIKWRTFTLMGIVFLLTPAFLISLSDKYQGELIRYGFGMGYIPVYIQYYGLLMILAGCLVFLLRSISRGTGRKVIGFVVLAALDFILLVNLQNNAIVVDKANIDLFYRRQALEEALKNNILQGVPENSRILIVDEYSYDPYPKGTISDLREWAANGYNWKTRALVYLHSGRRMRVYTDLVKLLGDSALKDGGVDYRKDNVYVLTICSYPEELHKKEGYVTIRKIKDIIINKADINKSRVELEHKSPDPQRQRRSLP